MNKPDFQDPDIAPHRTMGTPIELTKPRGEREKRAQRDVNENVLEKLRDKGLIGESEYQAGLRYHSLCRSATIGLRAVDTTNEPVDGGGFNGEAMAVAVAELGRIHKAMGNGKTRREFYTVLCFALHPQHHMSLSALDTAMGYPKNMMHGRKVLVMALQELAEIMGFANSHAR